MIEIRFAHSFLKDSKDTLALYINLSIFVDWFCCMLIVNMHIPSTTWLSLETSELLDNKPCFYFYLYLFVQYTNVFSKTLVQPFDCQEISNKLTKEDSLCIYTHWEETPKALIRILLNTTTFFLEKLLTCKEIETIFHPLQQIL